MDIDRREFLRLGATATAATAAAGIAPPLLRAVPEMRPEVPGMEIEEATIAELQAAMAAGRLSAVRLTRTYEHRIEALDRNGPSLNSILQVNPDAGSIAKGLDREPRARQDRGPPHGAPRPLKDHLPTADQMLTPGGSLALAAPRRPQHAAATAGTETDGSIVCPASICGIVGIKPTVGLTSRAGVVPISHSQDTIGPHARTVADAATLLGGMASKDPDPRDPATNDNRDKV